MNRRQVLRRTDRAAEADRPGAGNVVYLPERHLLRAMARQRLDFLADRRGHRRPVGARDAEIIALPHQAGEAPS